jgi:epoxyqueuosine reductase
MRNHESGLRHTVPDQREVGFVDLVWLLEMTHEQYLERFRGTAVRRAKHWMIQRNAAVALGNVGDVDALPALNRALTTNPHPIVRGHAAWAIGQIGKRTNDSSAKSRLAGALSTETDESAREEIAAALDIFDAPG